MLPTFIDYETCSGADLRSVGGRAYARHPSTRIVCACASGPLGEATLRYGGDAEAWATSVLKLGGDTVVWHNGDSFDRFIAERYTPQLLTIPSIDTIHMARAGGLPAGLDALAQHFLGVGKDAGKDLMLKVAKLNRDPVTGEWGNKWLKPGYIEVVTRYCVQDVVLLQRLFPHLLRYHRPEAVELDRRINDRGIGFDERLAAQIAECSAQLVAESGVAIEKLTGGRLKATDLRSGPKMAKWLESQGIKLENLRKETVKRFIDESVYTPVEQLLADEPELDRVAEVMTDDVKVVLQLRSSALRITASKLERASAVCFNGRLYDLRIHNGAHTTRRTGRIVQPHNLPSGVEGCDVDGLCDNLCLESVRREVTRLEGIDIRCSADDVLSSLIRPCFIPAPGCRFVVADFSQIEARILAWLAGEESLLATFRTGGDIYVTSAAMMFGVRASEVTKTQRKVGKIQQLAGGYGGGAGTFNVFALNNGVKFDMIGLSPNDVVEGYRDSFPNIAGVRTGSYFKGVACRRGGIWKAYDKAFRKATAGETVTTNHVTFRKDGVNVEMVVPSGKVITYRQAAIERHMFPGDDESRECIMFNHPVRGRRTTHGGPLTQNVCEAIGNDLLNIALQTGEDRGFNPVLEVHDEGVFEVPAESADRALSEILGVMGTVPSWAEGLPVAAAGHVSRRYTK